mmetsp:Transcript_55140/g.170797  ORF Transcript_55140/g.170797 Transcript_55140/m.170797 type:complete len:115 (-) Transcript_55140:127-471(-)
MGQGACRRRREPPTVCAAVGCPGNFAGGRATARASCSLTKEDSDEATDEDRSTADRLCRRCVLAYSRVARESIEQAKTVGELREYVRGLRERELALGGYDGGEDREREGLAGGS